MIRKDNRPAGANGGAAATNTANYGQYNTIAGAVSIRQVRRADGRIVGELAGDVLRKNAKREHMLQRPPAWAWVNGRPLHVAPRISPPGRRRWGVSRAALARAG